MACRRVALVTGCAKQGLWTQRHGGLAVSHDAKKSVHRDRSPRQNRGSTRRLHVPAILVADGGGYLQGHGDGVELNAKRLLVCS
jgi:hypothetical protein